MILVYITYPSKKEAEKAAGHLLKKKLVACANIFPIQSLYHWKGSLASEEEFVLLGKTKEQNYKNIKEEVSKIHSYEVPCIIKIPIEVNKEYGKWMEGELGPFDY
ncbi:divalent-cation tolerance protein CutA [candidate division WS5 bacterium]|uniref:Divalent-cation tolerance protein CutA n=1 Tax=candidate division WS5 bacterium TaxID=2093353 RepID=A0A419DAF9_9BACT|nr:MAG: divalent-cation tolerance protein CutA [candidate division WS5 bacterium]